MICNICTEKRTNFIDCPECKKSTCKKCTKTHIMTSSHLLTPQCMYTECRIGWSYEFMHKNLGKSFPKRYLDAVTDFLFTRETALLPQTKVLAEKVKRRLARQENHAVNDIIVDVLTKYGEKYSNVPKFYGFCPMKGCEGALTEAFICALCKCTTCAECRKEEHAQANCKKEDIDTVKLFEKFRPCPMCKTPIEKTAGGCDEMFCVKCHTSFSWATGIAMKKEKIIHNPHRYEWLKESKQEIPISAEPNVEEEIIKLNTMRTEVAESKARFTALLSKRAKLQKENKVEELADLATQTLMETDKFVSLQNEARRQDMYIYMLEGKRDNVMMAEFVQSAIRGHPQFSGIGKIASCVDSIQYQYIPVYEKAMLFDNTDLRIKLILNRIDENRAKLHLRCRYLFKQRLTAVKMILSSFVESANIIFNSILVKSVVENSQKLKAPTEVVDKMLQDLEALREFTEKSLKELESVYGPLSLKFEKTWEFEDNERFNKMGILRAKEKQPSLDIVTNIPNFVPGANLQETFNNIMQALTGVLN